MQATSAKQSLDRPPTGIIEDNRYMQRSEKALKAATIVDSKLRSFFDRTIFGLLIILYDHVISQPFNMIARQGFIMSSRQVYC